MGVEIERKFLIKNNSWQQQVSREISIQQGFLSRDKQRTVRVRIANNIGKLTIKGIAENATRQEFEYNIPLKDAQALIKICIPPIIQKTRFEVVENNLLWEIDVFDGDLKGLIVAEIELESENQEIEIPDWIGVEVTNDARYYNANLVKFPFD